MSTKDELLKALAVGITQGAEIYGPAISRLDIDDLVYIMGITLSGKGLEAQNFLRPHMTVEELATEKVRLAALTRLLVAEEAKIRALAIKILNRLLESAFGLALGI